MRACFTPTWLDLGKTTHFNISLDQVDELHVKITYKAFHRVRKNIFLPLHAGKNAKGMQMANFLLYKIMEL